MEGKYAVVEQIYQEDRTQKTTIVKFYVLENYVRKIFY